MWLPFKVILYIVYKVCTKNVQFTNIPFDQKRSLI